METSQQSQLLNVTNHITMKRILCFTCAVVVFISAVQFASAAASVTAKENLAKLVATKSCPGCDLSGLNFNRMDLSRVNLEGADLSMSSFFLTNLSYANLKNTTLSGAVFGGADLGDADLTGADLRGVSLDSAYLGGTKMTGEIVTTKPLEKLGVDEVEKDVYVESQTIPKKPPEQKEVKISNRRDFGETPPVIATKKDAPVMTKKVITAVDSGSPPENTTPTAPPAKKSMKVEQVSVPVVEEDVVADNGVPAAADKKTEALTHKGSEARAKTEKAKVAPVVTAVPVIHKTDKAKEIEEVEDQMIAQVDKAKLLLLDTLLDTKSCYGCDLSGLDLSRKKLKKADLEKANLSGCNLEKTDLRGANLKGAILVKANMKKARLNGADLYKANLDGADLTGASQKNISLDGALLDGAVGVDVPVMLQN